MSARTPLATRYPVNLVPDPVGADVTASALDAPAPSLDDAVRVTAAVLQDAYRLLLNCRAFHGVGMPSHPRLVASKSIPKWGDCWVYPYPTIRISAHLRTLHAIQRTMAHEMVHIALEQAGSKGWYEHGADFRAMRASICRELGWRQRGF